MDRIEARIQLLEERTLNTERHLKRWRMLTFILGISVLMSYSIRLQRPFEVEAQTLTRFPAPFEITTQAKGKTMRLMRVDVAPSGPNLVGAALTLYANDQPAASLMTTGALYKDAEDPTQSYLNLLETFLYKYPANGQPKPLLASSLALTRAGGSLVLWNNTDAQGSQPSHAARLTAKRGVGGTLILSSDKGVEVLRLPASK